MKNDKKRLLLTTILTIAVFGTIVLYSLNANFNKKLNFGDLLPPITTLIVVAFMVFFILRRYRDIKEGMPLEDERSKKVIMQAAAKSFYFSLYWLLAISWFESFFAKMFGSQQLTASQTTGGGIAGMAIFFIASWIYYDRKGKLI